MKIICLSLLVSLCLGIFDIRTAFSEDLSALPTSLNTPLSKRYSNSASALVVVYENLPPYFYFDKQTQTVKGSCIDTLKRLIDIPMEYKQRPWKRALKMIENNEADIIPCASRTIERQSKGIHFIGPIVNDELIVVHIPEKHISKDNFRLHHGLFINGDSVIEEFGITNYSSIATPEQLIRLLEARRADYTIAVKSIFESLDHNKILMHSAIRTDQYFLTLSPRAAQKLNLQHLQQQALPNK